MKVSFDWLKELVDLKVSNEELVNLLPLRTIGTKEVTKEFVELDMKGYNRSDLLSMRGVALEVAATTESKVKFEEKDKFIWEDQSLPALNIEITEPDLASVYCLAKIEGLQVGKSSPEIVQKLSDSGMRSVNNIADITNLIMLEYGQPLHAFDADSVNNENIIVRTAKPDEELVTLDGKVRKLTPDNLLIADPEKPLGIAGVMGGKNSEVTDSTTTILLEAAIFEPTNLRATAQSLNLHSEASKRFQHGLTVKRLLQAFEAAIKMYQDLGGRLAAITLHGDISQKEPLVIPVDLEKVNSLIGIELSRDQVLGYLERLNCKGEFVGEAINVIPPFYREDLNIQEDIIEEIARLYGYENIPAKKLEGDLPKEADQTRFKTLRRVKEKLAEIGLTEVQTYSYFSTEVMENFGWDKEPARSTLIKILNPMSKETTYMRQSIWENLIEVISKNEKYNFDDIAIFEVGKGYSAMDKKVEENWAVSAALMNSTDNPVKEIHQIFMKLIKEVGFEIEVKQGEIPEQMRGIFHPTRFLQILKNGEWIGGMAEIHPRVLDKFGIKNRVAVFEINLSELL